MLVLTEPLKPTSGGLLGHVVPPPVTVNIGPGVAVANGVTLENVSPARISSTKKTWAVGMNGAVGGEVFRLLRMIALKFVRFAPFVVVNVGGGIWVSSPKGVGSIQRSISSLPPVTTL